MIKQLFPLLLLVIAAFSPAVAQSISFPELSSRLLQAVKEEQPATEYVQRLREADPDELAAALNTDDRRKTFWINVYNAFIILQLRENPALYEDRGAFFSADNIEVAGEKLSFDKIEHGILRRSKVKLSLGYLDKTFVDAFEKRMRVTEVDWRIHFALNCGAKACPPVEVYRVETLNAQLDKRALAYLTATTRYDAAAGKVEVTTLMNWFRADFGGEEGVLDILKKRTLLPSGASPSISYSDYDWTLDIRNFAE